MIDAAGHSVAGSERWSSYDRPAMQKDFVTTNADGTRTAHLLLNGVHCAACVLLIENTMTTAPGVGEITVNPVTTRADIRWDPGKVTLSHLLCRIADLGYTPYPHTEDETERLASAESRASLKRLIVAGLGMMQIATYAVALYAGAFQSMDPDIERFLRLISLLVATPVVLYSGRPFFMGAWRDIKAKHPGMDVPIGLAIGAAYSASVWNTLTNHGQVYFDSATMFIFFLSVARHLEMTGRHRVLGLTDAFARHVPRVASRIEDGRIRDVGVMELAPGDRVLVQPGQTFPADGCLEGSPVRIDESLLTGESEPVLKQPGDTIVAGGINQHTAATLRIQRIGADTALAQISRLMTAAQDNKPSIVQLADRVASRFVGGVLIAATAIGFTWWMIAPERAFEIVLAVLVVTCPCALALAMPAAFTVATSALARRGFLLRRTGVLEEFGRVSDIVFDKTGTLTDRKVTLHRTETYGGQDSNEALHIAAALESHSEHPLASAFTTENAGSGPDWRDVTEVTAYPGEGLEGQIHGRRYRIGTGKFIAALSSSADPARVAPDHDLRCVYLGDEHGVIARFDIAESVKPGAAEAISALTGHGIRTLIASGDRQRPVGSVARRLGVGAFHAELAPADKLALVRELQAEGKTVAMVGDGINDSPVLAGANISIAMGSGTSLAQHSSDCVMMNENLMSLVEAFDISRQTMRVVRQNLTWAVGYNLVALPLAATGILAPWMAALGMSASSLIVTANALRLSRPQTGTLTTGEPAIASATESEAPCCTNSAEAVR
jgi:Cu2+-exporting ATPase